MADFCKQCSIEMFGKDFGDFKGLISRWKSWKGYGVPVLCEGCGFILVNHKGKRIKTFYNQEEMKYELNKEKEKREGQTKSRKCSQAWPNQFPWLKDTEED